MQMKEEGTDYAIPLSKGLETLSLSIKGFQTQIVWILNVFRYISYVPVYRMRRPHTSGRGAYARLQILFANVPIGIRLASVLVFYYNTST